MSTNKSQTLKLHLWEPEDHFLRAEFNENFAAIDIAVKADRASIAQAQNAANAAQGTANTARAEAAVLPYVVGSYTGTGAEMTITLGFRPSFVIISGMQPNSRGDYHDEYIRYNAISGGNVLEQRLVLTDTGFQLVPSVSTGYLQYPELTKAERVYDYIAFR